MSTLAHTGTAVARATPAKTGKRTVLVFLATVAVIMGVTSGVALNQLDRAVTMLQSFLLRNHFSSADIEVLGILSAAFAPSIGGLLLAFFARGLLHDGKE